MVRKVGKRAPVSPGRPALKTPFAGRGLLAGRPGTIPEITGNNDFFSDFFLKNPVLTSIRFPFPSVNSGMDPFANEIALSKSSFYEFLKSEFWEGLLLVRAAILTVAL